MTYAKSFYKNRGIVIENYKGYCATGCGEMSVDVHHMDENKHNNTITNLVPLCKECHRQAHKKYFSC